SSPRAPPQRHPDGARAEAAGVAAEASPPRAGSEGRSPATGGRRGRRDRRPPQLPRAPAAHEGTRRPTERAWSEDREPGAAPPPTARTEDGERERRAAAGTVAEIRVEPGQAVEAGELPARR